MFDIKDLQRFGKRNEEVQQNQSKDVWCYTRVSTKDQQTNFSLENQLEAAKRFALKNGYNLVKTFGSKNESAKDDFSRKEFTRLLAEVKKEKEKPFAIIVFMIDRFSRSGGHSITLASELIDVQGVHLIEIVSGIDTTTSKGRNELNQRLLQPRKKP
jgi:DNA invertase Pin-like site-specific DNA recombinase